MNEPNAAQAAAIHHRNGPALVLAGPGSGKTFVITRRLQDLIIKNKIRPSSLLTITYTNAAAKEMKKRAYTLLGNAASDTTFGTFHSVFYSVLKNRFGMSSSNILKAGDKFIILCDIAVKLGLDTADMQGIADELSSIISLNKNGMQKRDGLSDSQREQLLFLYGQRLKEERLLDFDDMILKCLKLFKKEPETLRKWQELYRYIQVDEFQDINISQYEILMLLAGPEKNVFAVGDDDQSIYGFRGASPGIMMRFLRDCPEASKYELNVNYRCKNRIMEASDSVITLNTLRLEKHHEAFDLTGGLVEIRRFPDRMEEIEGILDCMAGGSPGNCAVLTRTNALASFFAKNLEKRGIPAVSGNTGSLYDSETAKDIIAYMKLASGKYERSDILRVMNKPLRYLSREAFSKEGARIGDVVSYYISRPRIQAEAKRFVSDIKMMGSLRPKAALLYLKNVAGYGEYLLSEGRPEDDLSSIIAEAGSFSSIREWLAGIKRDKKRTVTDKDKASVMTLHASKGLEFKEVFIVDVNEGIIPYHRAKFPEELEEERRLFYVGMTRAQCALHLFYIDLSFGKALSPSSFIPSIENYLEQKR